MVNFPSHTGPLKTTSSDSFVFDANAMLMRGIAVQTFVADLCCHIFDVHVGCSTAAAIEQSNRVAVAPGVGRG